MFPFLLLKNAALLRRNAFLIIKPISRYFRGNTRNCRRPALPGPGLQACPTAGRIPAQAATAATWPSQPPAAEIAVMQRRMPTANIGIKMTNCSRTAMSASVTASIWNPPRTACFSSSGGVKGRKSGRRPAQAGQQTKTTRIPSAGPGPGNRRTCAGRFHGYGQVHKALQVEQGPRPLRARALRSA